MEYRTEKDSMGEVRVPEDRYWGAQTQRSLENFRIGEDLMPVGIIRAFAIVKKACARANAFLGALDEERAKLISRVCDEILDGSLDRHFPLSVFQTGSGTQTNMNVNEVISNRGNELSGRKLLHPNDHVNRSQSSNDTFPTALHVAALLSVKNDLEPALSYMTDVLYGLEKDHEGVLTVGRTHLQDAVPIAFSREIGAWRAAVERSRAMVEAACAGLYELALGGTAVGNGLNCPEGFSDLAVSLVAKQTGLPFVPADNKYRALSSKGDIAFAHGAFRTLAADLYKIACDVRLLSSGPRCGFGEISIPENEPGSSIMPGKVNPTQCEALIMASAEVMGNDVTVGLASSGGQLQLNACMPVIAYDFLRSARLLSDSVRSFTAHCLVGLSANRKKMEQNLSRTLMTVTALTPKIGYDAAAAVAKAAKEHDTTLREEAIASGVLTGEEFDRIMDVKNMV